MRRRSGLSLLGLIAGTAIGVFVAAAAFRFALSARRTHAGKARQTVLTFEADGLLKQIRKHFYGRSGGMPPEGLLLPLFQNQPESACPYAVGAATFPCYGLALQRANEGQPFPYRVEYRTECTPQSHVPLAALTQQRFTSTPWQCAAGDRPSVVIRTWHQFATGKPPDSTVVYPNDPTAAGALCFKFVRDCERNEYSDLVVELGELYQGPKGYEVVKRSLALALTDHRSPAAEALTQE